jgi:ketosteroid isomerase-like protein
MPGFVPFFGAFLFFVVQISALVCFSSQDLKHQSRTFALCLFYAAAKAHIKAVNSMKLFFQLPGSVLALSLLASLCLAPAAFARSYELNTPEARAMAGVIDQVLSAHSHKDLNQLMAQFHPDAKALWSNDKQMNSYQELMQTYKESFLGYKNFSGTWLPEYLDIEENMAWMTGEMSWSAHSLETGQPIQLTVRTTYILRKRGDRWLIVWEHSSHRRSD